MNFTIEQLRSIMDLKNNIRSMSVIAHVDHGKSTLCDRLYERALGLKHNSSKSQFLDDLQVERERGITVKARPLSIVASDEGQSYLLNLVDTPGHSDFYGEVTRTLQAVEGAVLLVDATQGVQAQTVAALRAARDAGCTIVPCLNKVDLPSADVAKHGAELAALANVKPHDVFQVSAKTGRGVPELLEALPYLVPPPGESPDTEQQSPRVLLLDAKAVPHKRGLVCTVRVLRGSIAKAPDKPMLNTKTRRTHVVHEVGVFDPDLRQVEELREGHVGWVCVSMKAGSGDFVAGSELVEYQKSAAAPQQGRSGRGRHAHEDGGGGEELPFCGIFCGVFPLPGESHHAFQTAIDKLVANEPSVHAQMESSQALGLGMRLGFQGPLHKEVFLSRLYQEHNVEVICTSATVPYRISWGADDAAVTVASPEDFKKTMDTAERAVHTRSSRRIHTHELVVNLNVLCRSEDVGAIVTLLSDRRGVPCADPDSENASMDDNLSGFDWITLTYRIPLSAVVDDTFSSEVKSLSSGYASYKWSVIGFEPSDIVRLDFLVDGTVTEPLAQLVHRDKAQELGNALVQELAEGLSRRQYDVILQAAIGTRVVARSTVKAVRKDVTAKCYGGDITRKRKLLEKQKEGKKRMREQGTQGKSASGDVESAYVDLLRAQSLKAAGRGARRG